MDTSILPVITCFMSLAIAAWVLLSSLAKLDRIGKRDCSGLVARIEDCNDGARITVTRDGDSILTVHTRSRVAVVPRSRGCTAVLWDNEEILAEKVFDDRTRE